MPSAWNAPGSRRFVHELRDGAVVCEMGGRVVAVRAGADRMPACDEARGPPRGEGPGCARPPLGVPLCSAHSASRIISCRTSGTSCQLPMRALSSMRCLSLTADISPVSTAFLNHCSQASSSGSDRSPAFLAANRSLSCSFNATPTLSSSPSLSSSISSMASSESSLVWEA